MKNKLWVILLSLTFLVFFSACQEVSKYNDSSVSTADGIKGQSTPGGSDAVLPVESGECNDAYYRTQIYNLWAGQHNNIGSVIISNDEENIYVTFQTDGDVKLDEVHVNIYTDANSLPDKRPAPGLADYKMENIDDNTYTIIIPFSDLSLQANCGDTYYIIAHAALSNGETAYAGGKEPYDNRFKGAWFFIVQYQVTCCCEPEAIVYGIDRGESIADENRGKIYLMNMVSGDKTYIGKIAQEALDDADPTSLNTPNGYAWDYDNNRLYYAIETGKGYSELWFYDLGNGTNTKAGELEGISIPGATYYNGGYYFIDNNTDDFYRINLNPDGTIDSYLPKLGDISNNTKRFNFGDIVITKDGKFYGSGRKSNNNNVRENAYVFFTLNIADGSGYTEIYSNGPNDQSRPQIGIGGDGTIYGNSGTQYFIVGLDGTLTKTVVGGINFNDLASGPRCVESR